MPQTRCLAGWGGGPQPLPQPRQRSGPAIRGNSARVFQALGSTAGVAGGALPIRQGKERLRRAWGTGCEGPSGQEVGGPSCSGEEGGQVPAHGGGCAGDEEGAEGPGLLTGGGPHRAADPRAPQTTPPLFPGGDRSNLGGTFPPDLDLAAVTSALCRRRDRGAGLLRCAPAPRDFRASGAAGGGAGGAAS